MMVNNIVIGVLLIFIRILIFVLKCYCRLKCSYIWIRKCDIFLFLIDNGILCKILIMKFFVCVFINIFKDFLGVIIGFFFVL